jgi:flavin-dependent dehydrogenase
MGREMKYDLIVIGGGPGGLMAAKTAAEDGLKVILVERKKNITEINRACLSVFYLHKVTASPEVEEGKAHADGYIDQVSVELFPDKCRFHFPIPGFSLDYDGSYIPYYHWIDMSPSGYLIYRHKPYDKIWALYYDKEVFLAGLLSSAQQAGAEIIPETIGIGAENTPDGVKVRVRGKSGEQTFEARTAIAADGISSAIVDRLGLNKERKVMTPPVKILDYEMEGVETTLPAFSLPWISIPSLNPYGNYGMGLKAGGKVSLFVMTSGTLTPKTALDNFMKYPTFAPWFRNARIVKKTAASAEPGLRTPIGEPVVGNVVIVGDAGAPVETWIQGAIACGYQAVKAIKKELNGQKGYPEYIDWWQRAFAFNDPHYWKMAAVFPLNHICTDEEVDYLYSLFRGRIGCYMGLIAKNLELIKKERLELYEKLIKTLPPEGGS